MTEPTVAAGRVPTCPLPAAVTMDAKVNRYVVTPCTRHEAHGGSCRPAEPQPEPEPTYADWYAQIGATPCLTMAEARAHAGLDPIETPDVLDTFTAPPLDAESDWFKAAGIDVGTDESVPVSHFEIRQDGSVLARAPFGAGDATWLAYDPARPQFGSDPHTIATPEAVHDAVRRYAEAHQIECYADDEWKARRDASNARIRGKRIEQVVYDEGDAIEGFPSGWQDAGFTALDWPLPVPVEEPTPTVAQERLADAAVNVPAARRPAGYDPQATPIRRWQSEAAAVPVVWKIVDRILDRMPPTSRDLRAAATAALIGAPAPVRQVSTIAHDYADPSLMGRIPYAVLAEAWTAEAVRARLAKVVP